MSLRFSAWAYSVVMACVLSLAVVQTAAAWLVWTSLVACASLAGYAVWLHRRAGTASFRTVVAIGVLTGALTYTISSIVGASFGMMAIGAVGHIWRFSFVVAFALAGALLACGIAAVTARDATT